VIAIRGKQELSGTSGNRAVIVIRLQKMLAARRENNQERAGEMLRSRESGKGPCAVKRQIRGLCRFFRYAQKMPGSCGLMELWRAGSSGPRPAV
jgi:hypothetical protein